MTANAVGLPQYERLACRCAFVWMSKAAGHADLDDTYLSMGHCCCSSATDRGRFSFMGGREGPLWRRITYKAPMGTPSAANLGVAATEDASGHLSQVGLMLAQLDQADRVFTCSQLYSPVVLC